MSIGKNMLLASHVPFRKFFLQEGNTKLWTSGNLVTAAPNIIAREV